MRTYAGDLAEWARNLQWCKGNTLETDTMKPFDYCIYYVPQEDGGGSDDVREARIVLTGQLLARDAETAKLKAIRECPTEWAEYLGDGLEVAVRPFC